MRFRHETYGAIFNGVYVALMANILLIVGCAPLVALLLVTDPARSWPLLVLAAPLCMPAVVGVFAVMAEFSRNRGASVAVLRTFGRVWLASWRRAVLVGALGAAAFAILGVDVAWAWGQRIGAAAIPVLVALMVLTLVTGLLTLVVLAERPAVRVRDALRASLYLAVRRWYLTAVSLVVLAVLLQLVAAKPALGMGLAAGPLLYVVWANSRFSLRPALDPPADETGTTTAAPAVRSTSDGRGRGRRTAAARA